MNKILFGATNNQSTDSILIISGVARSGKTTLGNILGSCIAVEHVEEPKPFVHLPILSAFGSINEPLSVNIFKSYIYDLWYERLIMRNVNFRPMDESSIWKQKTIMEIIYRTLRLNDRKMVQRYLDNRNSSLVLTLTHTIPFCDFFWKALPQSKILHVVREGVQVAMDVTSKGWLANEQLIEPQHASPYRLYLRKKDGTKFHLPFWVENGYEERYLNMSLFSRGIYYWRRLLEMYEDVMKLSMQTDLMHVVNFENILDNPHKTLYNLIDTLGFKPSRITKKLISRINRKTDEYVVKSMSIDVDIEELVAARRMYSKFNMSTDRIDDLINSFS